MYKENEVNRVYLSIKQHDQFRTLLMGFEIPFRGYIADVLMTHYSSANELETALLAKNASLTPADPFFLRDVLPNSVKHSKVEKMYNTFSTAASTTEIVAVDQDMPMVGALNIITFSLTGIFNDLYNLFADYSTFCDLAEKYRYARNKLDHPGCRTLEDNHLVPVLSFVKDICSFLDEKYFIQKTKEQIFSEITILQNRSTVIPVSKHNLSETPYVDSQIVCRDNEIAELKSFIYGNPGDLRKQHSRCIFGYGGVGKTALVVETIKQVIQDIIDNKTVNDYSPQYIFFFSAKKRKLQISDVTGRIIEKETLSHFETADELIALIHEVLSLETFKGYHDEGLIVVDNLEAVSVDDRRRIKQFIEAQTPPEMQFLLTSRNSEEYESNTRLCGFESEDGKAFVHSYIEENALDVRLQDSEINELLDIAKGNTLVLVLSLRRLSQKLIDVSGLRADFSCANVWKGIRKNIAALPPNAYESISNFMFKDTFEQIESVFDNPELFYEILKVFAVIPNKGIDLSTVCLLTNISYPEVEAVAETLCNYLIIERNENTYSLNQFAETYIIQRFIPDAQTFQSVSDKIEKRRREVEQALEKLDDDMKQRVELRNILKDWNVITDSDRITAAKMYNLYGQVNAECNRGGKFKVQAIFEDFIVKSEECEQITAHPFIKYQKARILQRIDDSNILNSKHDEEIRKNYLDTIFTIKMVNQYSAIQSTKSFASLLWIYGQFLVNHDDLIEAIRYLEDSKSAFEAIEKCDDQYYQCTTLLGWTYLNLYLKDRGKYLIYLRKARTVSRYLNDHFYALGRAKKYAKSLRSELQKYGQF